MCSNVTFLKVAVVLTDSKFTSGGILGGRRESALILGCIHRQCMYVANVIFRQDLLTKAKGQEVFTRMHRIDHVVTIDTVEDFGQVIIAAVFVDHLLDLVRIELLEVDDGEIVGEGAEDAVAAEMNDAVRDLLHGGGEVVNVGVILGEGDVVLGEKESQS